MNRTSLFALVLLSTGATLTGCSREAPPSSNPSLAFSTDWDASLAQAKAKKKPILLFFGGAW